MSTLIDEDLLAKCNEIWAATQAQEKDETLARLEPPLLRLWDGDYNLQHILACEYSANFEWVDNDSGTGATEIPFDADAALWIWDVQARMARGEHRNVHITVDKDGARWSGRMKDFSVQKNEDGTVVLMVRWLHDYENLKYYQVWSNPFLPAAVQFPRVFMLAGPAIWSLKLSLLLQIMRDQQHWWALPDDPLDPASWGAGQDMSDWSIVVKPTSFLGDMAAGTLWTVVSSRWRTWHDMAKRTLEDAELSVVARRFLDGDEQPWAGANLRHGALVIDIVDKSGYYTGTSNGGNIFTGLTRTVARFADDFIDTTLDLVVDTDIPGDYFLPGWKSTNVAMPYVIYREGEETGVRSSTFTYSPSTAIQVNVGGHSLPGVNEAISASIQALFDILGNLAQIGSVGGSVDSLLRPMYEDTLLAWLSVKSTARATNSGWSRYFEYFQDGADKAYTLSSLMVLRSGFWATKTWFTHELAIDDAAPFLVGDNGQGHFFLGDRIGATIPGDLTGEVYVDRVRKITLAWDRDIHPEWMPVIGDNRALQDPAQRAMELIEEIKDSIHLLGVY